MMPKYDGVFVLSIVVPHLDSPAYCVIFSRVAESYGSLRCNRRTVRYRGLVLDKIDPEKVDNNRNEAAAWTAVCCRFERI